MKNKFPKETKEAVLIAYAYLCANHLCCKKVTEFHHILPNTKVNQNKFPLYTQSPFNCYPICHSCHMNQPLPPKPNLIMVAYFEKYLKGLTNVSENDMD